jgi:Tfp pilus assembly protein PilO
MRFIIPIILLIISIASFVMFTNPSYGRIKTLRAQNAQYSEALANSRKLQEERDALGLKYNSIPPASLSRLTKMLPDTADNIRLIIDIQRIAQTYGLTLSSIKYDAKQTGVVSAKGTAVPTTPAINTAGDLAAASADYGTFSLEFGVLSTYENFLKFSADLESSLRLVDIQSVTFSNDSTGGAQNAGKTLFTIKLNTYWLKS